MSAPRSNEKEGRLFQNKFLTGIFGPNVATMLTRILLVLAAAGTLGIIAVGLLRPDPQFVSSISPNSSTSKQALVGIEQGDAAPNFTLSTLDGKKVSLSDFRGKAVVLNFWYSTCPGCKVEIPGMQRFYAKQQGAGKRFVILGVDIVDDASAAKQFVRQQGLTYPIVLDQDQRVEALYSISDTPTSFFIDRNGVIRAKMIGPVDDSTLAQNTQLLNS